MISLENGRNLVEKVSEFPKFANATNLFLDVETKRVFDHEKYGGLYPWKGDRICGFAVTIDDCKKSYYFPMRHSRGKNLPLESTLKFLRELITSCENWVNHNIIFDAIFCAFDGAEFDCRLVDTLTFAKIHDSDRFTFGLKILAKDWLDFDISESNKVEAFLEGTKEKGFHNVPTDILGKYACDDVRMNRLLYEYLVKYRPESMKQLWETEIALTAVLYDMQIEGLKIDPTECKIQARDCLRRMIDASTKIETITGREWSNSSQCMNEILCHQFGLPILGTIKEKDPETHREIDTGRPSFDKNIMPLYKVHPQVISNPELVELINLIIDYRQDAQHKGLFLDSFLELHDDNNFIHPQYNQVIRTGRMSCSRPNAQQQNERSKKLIHPSEGNGFMSSDYSQIEFRLIVHYINDVEAIAAYNRNPNTDFHQWVADLCSVKRPAGKTMNFGMAYGAGKRLVTKNLSVDPEIIKEIGEIVNQMVEDGKIQDSQRNMLFNELCIKRADEVYTTYHERIPGIKRTSYQASSVCKMRGYIFNAYGRRRYLSGQFTYKAFNTIIQGCAMDIIKERMIAIAPRYNRKSKELGIRIAANVHDDIIFEMPISVMMNSEIQKWIAEILESPSIKFRVPILVNQGISTNNWAEACNDEQILDDNNVIAGPIR